MELISRTELKEKVEKSQDLKLVFVLGEPQFRAMHIPGSVNLPCSENLYRTEDALRGLDRDDEIVVYCSSEACFASFSVYTFLVKRGYKNVSRYAGGLLDWTDAGYALEGETAIAYAGRGSS